VEENAQGVRSPETASLRFLNIGEGGLFEDDEEEVPGEETDTLTLYKQLLP